MIELTPLDVRKKKGDFSRGLRGYDPSEVDQFLGLVAKRLEEVVKVNLSLRERVEDLAARVEGQEGRERAVQDALVTAQSLKLDIQEQAKRDAERVRRESESDADRVRQESEREAERVRHDAERFAREVEEEAERALEVAQATIERLIADREEELADLTRRRSRFLESFRMLLERELEVVQVAEASTPDDGIDLDLVQFGQAAPAAEQMASGASDQADVSSEPTPEAAAEEAESESEGADSVEPAAEAPESGAPETDTPEVEAQEVDTQEAEALEADAPAATAPEKAAEEDGVVTSDAEETDRRRNGSANRSRREPVASRETGERGSREERWGAR